MNCVMNQTLPNIKLSDLLQGMGQVSGELDRSVAGLAIDSRKVSQGYLFIALPGTHQQGNDFIDEAIRNGACAVVVDAASVQLPTFKPTVPLLRIENITFHAGIIASRFYGEPSRTMTVTGITGTNGKTTCSILLAQCLHQLGAQPAVIGTLGMGRWKSLKSATHTTPDAITLQEQMALLREQNVDQLIMEVSSHGLQQGRVSGTEFNTAVLTNLSQDHLDYHGSMQSYSEAKAALFQQYDLNLAVLNVDDKFGRDLQAGPLNARAVITYGIESGEVYASQISLHEAGMHFTIHSPWGELQIESSLMGRFNVYNLLACAAVLLAAGFDADNVASSLSAAKPVAGRMECLRAEGVTAVVDFAHTPDALKQALTALRDHTQARRLICVFGCGGERDSTKRPQMGRIAEQLADRVIITDDNPRHEDPAQIRRDITAGMEFPDADSLLEIPDRRQAIRSACELAEPGDIILVAGKGHEATQQIGDLKIPFDDREVVADQFAEAGEPR